MTNDELAADRTAERVALARRHLGPVARGRLVMRYLDTPTVLTVEQRAFALGNDVRLMDALIEDHERNSSSLAATAMWARSRNVEGRSRWFADESRQSATRAQLVRDTRCFIDAADLALCRAAIEHELRAVQRWEWATVDKRFRCRTRTEYVGGLDQCTVHGTAFTVQRRRRARPLRI